MDKYRLKTKTGLPGLHIVSKKEGIFYKSDRGSITGGIAHMMEIASSRIGNEFTGIENTVPCCDAKVDTSNNPRLKIGNLILKGVVARIPS